MTTVRDRGTVVVVVVATVVVVVATVVVVVTVVTVVTVVVESRAAGGTLVDPAQPDSTATTIGVIQRPHGRGCTPAPYRHRGLPGASIGEVIEPRRLPLGTDALATLLQLVGIMTDQVMSGDLPRWDVHRLMHLEVLLETAVTDPDTPITLGIDDVAMLLEGMAFTEIASAELPWFDMVRWTSDFITAELRPYWTDDLWRAHMAS